MWFAGKIGDSKPGLPTPVPFQNRFSAGELGPRLPNIRYAHVNASKLFLYNPLLFSKHLRTFAPMSDDEIKQEVYRHVKLAIAASLLEASRAQNHRVTMSAFPFTTIARHMTPKYRPCLSYALYDLSRNDGLGIISKEMTRISNVYLAKFYLKDAPPGTTHTGEYYMKIEDEQKFKNWLRGEQRVERISEREGVSAFQVRDIVQPRRIGSAGGGRKTYFDRRFDSFLV